MKDENKNKRTIALPKCGMFIGSPIYLDRADYVFQHTGTFYTSWVSEDHPPSWYLRRIIEENQGNLAIIWEGSATQICLKSMADWMDMDGLGVTVPEPDWENKKFLTPGDWDALENQKSRYGAGFSKIVDEADQLGLYTYSIYSEANPEWVEKISNNKSFLGYNTGEKFSFDLQGAEASEFRETRPKVDAGYDLKRISTDFANTVKRFLNRKEKNGWRRFLITSASFHLDLEVVAAKSDIIPHVESFAFKNLNFGSSLCRGLYKQFDLPIWGNYLAHEHYSFLPYKSKHKFEMLDTAFLMSYMSGSKITVLESGNWWLQSDHVDDTPMHDTPKIDLGGIHQNNPKEYAHLVKEARTHYKKLNYDSAICEQYRKSLSNFYDFVKGNGTPEGQPEICLAAIKGNYDLCSQNYHPNMAIAGAYALAEKDPSWYEGMPERSWEIFRRVFYPLKNVLGDYVNSFFSGTPYGMTDIVSFAGTITPEFLAKQYKALLFTGWNTSSDKQYEILKQYVFNGGTLFVSIPHLSKNTTRNYANYSVDELVNNGDFSELCGVKVRKRGPQIYWMLAAENNSLNLPKYKHYGPFATHIGDIEITGTPETLAVHDETFTPTLLLNKYGKGKVYFLNSWEYPGALDVNAGPGATIYSSGLVGEVYKKIAVDNRGTAYITDDEISAGPSCERIVYSYFPSNGKVYLLNIDFEIARECFLHVKGRIINLKLAPLEFKII